METAGLPGSRGPARGALAPRVEAWGWRGTTRTSVLSLFEPITAIVLSAVVLKEQMTALQMLGALIVLSGGVLVVAMRDKTKKEPSLKKAA